MFHTGNENHKKKKTKPFSRCHFLFSGTHQTEFMFHFAMNILVQLYKCFNPTHRITISAPPHPRFLPYKGCSPPKFPENSNFTHLIFVAAPHKFYVIVYTVFMLGGWGYKQNPGTP